MLRNYLLAVFALFTGVCSAQAQTVEISGRITDNHYVAMPMASVRLIADNDTAIVGHTDNTGAFSFRITPAPRVQLIVSYVGFETDYRYIAASSDLNVDIILYPSSVQIGEAVITARSRALVRNTDYGAVTINTQRMSNIPSLLGSPDIMRTLQLMPGVQQSGEGNGYIYVRGTDPGHNLILYNNVPVYGTSHLLGIFPFYNADHIERIHFDKSGSAVEFGNRLGAAIQCLPHDMPPDTLAIKGNIGVLASQLTVSSPLGKKAGIIFSGRQTYIDWIITPLLNNAKSNYNIIDDISYSFNDANLTLMLRPNEKHRIDLNAFASGDRFGIEDERMLLVGTMKWGNQLASANWEYAADNNVKINNKVYISRYGNLLNVGQASLDMQVVSETLDWGFHNNIDFKLRSTPFRTGLQYANYRVRPQEMSSTQLPVLTETENSVDARLVSAYLHGSPQLGAYFSLDLGLRIGFFFSKGNNQTTDLQLEPRISLNFADNNRWDAYLSYARKSQHLHLITTSSVGLPTDFWLATSEGIPVELADNFSVGFNYKLSSQLELTAGLFYSRMNNLVQYPFSVLQFNEITNFRDDLLAGKGKAYGAETMLKKTGRLSGWLSYTWSKSDRQFDGIDNGQPFPSKFDRRHDLSIVAHYEISQRWSVGLSQVFTSGSRFTAPTSWYFINNNPVKEYGRYNNAKMPNYKRTDISIDYYIKKTSRRENALNISVYNLLAVDNPIYVILDVRSSETGNAIEVMAKYKSIYTILPSVSWRFRF